MPAEHSVRDVRTCTPRVRTHGMIFEYNTNITRPLNMASVPVFYVPAIPKHLKKIPPLKQFDRPPMVGYDMRTLRKQIDLLYNVRLLIFRAPNGQFFMYLH